LSWESLEKHSQISVRTLSDKPTIIVVHCKLRSHVLKNQDLRFFYNFQNFVTESDDYNMFSCQFLVDSNS